MNKLWGSILGASALLFILTMTACAPEGSDLSDQTACERDRDCDDNEYCDDNGECRDLRDYNECDRDRDCRSGEICDHGWCVDDRSADECRFDDDCGRGQICSRYGECVRDTTPEPDDDECSYDRDCRSDETCDRGTCVYVQPRSECSFNDDCQSGERCSSGRCVRDSAPPSGGRTGYGSVGPDSGRLFIESPGTGASWERICVDGEYLESCSLREELHWQEKLGCVYNYSGIRFRANPPSGTCAFRFQVELCNAKVSNPRADDPRDWDCVWYYEGNQSVNGNRRTRFGVSLWYNDRSRPIEGVDISYYDEHERRVVDSSSGYSRLE